MYLSIFTLFDHTYEQLVGMHGVQH